MADTDLHILFAKIRSLSKRRIAEVDDFVDFLSRHGAVRRVTPPPDFEEQLAVINKANRERLGLPPRTIGLPNRRHS
jgi:hypothetical protein